MKNVSNSGAFHFLVGHSLLLRKLFSCFPTDQCDVSQNRLRMRCITCFLSIKEQKILWVFCLEVSICLPLKIKMYSKLIWRSFFPLQSCPMENMAFSKNSYRWRERGCEGIEEMKWGKAIFPRHPKSSNSHISFSHVPSPLHTQLYSQVHLFT